MNTSSPMQPTEESDFYRLVFEQAGMAMVVADSAGGICAWNYEAARMFGAGTSEMLGTDWLEIVPHEDRDQARRLFSACLETGVGAEFEFSLRGVRGENRRLAAVMTPIVEAGGVRTGALACVRDITNRMLLQKRLAQQSKMASLGEMAGALSHHFNNILGGVVTSVDFALASGDPRILARVMEKTAAALSRATGLVENLLAFAQGDFRDATLCDLGEVMIDLINRSEARLKGTGIKVEIGLRSIPVVEVPRSALTTVFTNLVDNAAEAMPEGGTLRIALDSTEDEALVSIGDTGCGLDEESLTRIFEPFYSKKTGPQGLSVSRGLGLAVAHGILKVLRGSIQVTSTEGEGTLFEVRIPLHPPIPARDG